MAEAEDVITDAARHATAFAQDLWRRRRPVAGPAGIALADVVRRLDLLIASVFGARFRLRAAQAPPPPTFLGRLFLRGAARAQQAIPATDGRDIWLPSMLPFQQGGSMETYRLLALQQAMRAWRQAPQACAMESEPLVREAFLLYEAHAADRELTAWLPGLAEPLAALRRRLAARRPPVHGLPSHRQDLERLAISLLEAELARPDAVPPPQASLQAAHRWVAALRPEVVQRARKHPLLQRDWWTGEFRSAGDVSSASAGPAADGENRSDEAPARSAHLARRPEVRKPLEDEDDDRQGAWMVQTAQPNEHVEDPMGLQRPTDRDEQTAAEDFADSVSELPEARLVAAPGKPKEILLSDDPPEPGVRRQAAPAQGESVRLSYPEWDYRLGGYRSPGAIVHLLPAAPGPQQWVERTLAEHGAMLTGIRRRFEMLRSLRERARRQFDGEEVDLDAYIDSYADYRAGLTLDQALYQTLRRSRRSMGIFLLVDASGSTDGWISERKRVVDVEREALLLVCIALESMAEPWCVQTFSGEGPAGVVMRSVKRFDEPYGGLVAQRIAAIEPEHYTRVGAAIRHATTLLMRQSVHYRLLLLLSDGKPNDVDEYEGRYGVEDMRQAVVEACLQGIHPFCLTIDKQAANYLPLVFGAGQYALLPRPQLLPTVLLEWIRRLATS